MRTASFFILSLALHIGALLYPVSFRERLEAQLFPVTILPVEPGPGNAAGAGSSGRAASRVSSKPATIAPRPAKPATEIKSPQIYPEQQPITAEPAPSISESPAVITESARPSVAESAPVYDWGGETGSSGVDIGGGDGGRSNSPSHFGGGSGKGFGAGFKEGIGQGSAESSLVLTQARYSETPTPLYPESARRNGREGRVLLRVLVDDQGRAKTVEVNTSSGSELLDRAAAEAIKRWRFHPARYGDKPVESWIRIPIEFRLASANP